MLDGSWIDDGRVGAELSPEVRPFGMVEMPGLFPLDS